MAELLENMAIDGEVELSGCVACGKSQHGSSENLAAKFKMEIGSTINILLGLDQHI